jgi:hypothetical protein
VERLRVHARTGDGWTRPDCAEAADEIERLREANAKAAKVITQCHSALSVLALATVGSHIAQRALRNIEETLQ